MGAIGVSSGAFKNNSNITSVKFGSKCTFVGKEAFKECTLLETINDDNVIETIGEGAFYNTKLSSVTFKSLKNINGSSNTSGAFQNCINLSDISIPNCESIGDNAFNSCTSLNEINLSNVTSIGNYAFYNCSNLKSVNISKPSIHNYAFASCSNLSNIYLNNCSEIGEGAFLGCISLNTINLNECKKIGSSAFYNTNITQLTLSKCEEIYQYAFANCYDLKKVYINTESATCRLMGYHVFCIHDPSSSTCSINENIVFYFRPSTLDDYKSASYWSHYANNMVAKAGKNEIIYITDDKNTIEFGFDSSDSDSDSDNNYDNKYEGNFGLISSNNDIITLNKISTEGKTTLISVDLPSACETIKKYAFEGCKSLKSITLSETLKTIEEFAFKGCTSLTEFEIPNTITKLEEGIFAGCKSLKKIYGNTNFVKYDGRAIASGGQPDSDSDSDSDGQSGSTLICVLPNDDSDTEGRIYKISEIDENITRLGESCFSGCEKLRRVDISPNVKEIGNNAFEGCKNLREIHFSSATPPKLGKNAFGQIREDFKIFVPEESLKTYIGKWNEYVNNIYPMPNNNEVIYFTNNDEGIDLQLPSNVTSETVNENDIKKYFKLSGITSIPSNLFEGKDVTKVILGENVKKLSNGAFFNCTQLDYIHLSDNITTIEDYCFWGCSKLKSIHIPKLSQSAFGGYDIFDSTLEEFGTYYKGYVSDDNRCYIDRDTRTLMFFAKGSLNNKTGYTYTIPDNITKINNYVFSKSNITSITLKPSVRTISPNAFYRCSELTSIEEWDNVESIGDYAFGYCHSLGAISLPEKLTNIGRYAFRECVKMYMKKNIPNSVTSIREGAFCDCRSFKCLDINENPEIIKLKNITSISDYLFYGCTNISRIEISSNVTEIGTSAFRNCTNLISVISSGKFERLTNIGYYAFSNCGKLKKFDLDKADYIESINKYAFYKCSNYKGGDSGQLLLKNISPSGIGDYSFSESGIEKLKISSSCKLKEIGTRAFSQCKNLKCVDMSESQYMQSIGSYAFYECKKLESIKLSNSIVLINDYAFNLCENIFFIELPTKLKTLGEKCFAFNNNNEAEIHIPNRLNPPSFTRNGTNNANIDIFGNTSPKIICKNSTDTNTYKNNTYWKQYSPIISTGSPIYISTLNAYLEYNTFSYKYDISNIGIFDISRHIYLYNSLWKCYKNAPFSFGPTSQSDIMLVVDKESLEKWYYKTDGDVNYRYNISIPMITNDNKKFRILCDIKLTSSTIYLKDVMLSMNTSTYNGEDYDNIAHFYYNNNEDLNGDTQLQIDRYKFNHGTQTKTIKVPGMFENDILPSRVYMNSSNSNQKGYKMSIWAEDGWKQFDNIDISEYFSLLQNFKDSNYSFSDMLDAIGMSFDGVHINFSDQ